MSDFRICTKTTQKSVAFIKTNYNILDEIISNKHEETNFTKSVYNCSSCGFQAYCRNQTVKYGSYRNGGQSCFTINKYEAVGIENSLELFEKNYPSVYCSLDGVLKAGIKNEKDYFNPWDFFILQTCLRKSESFKFCDLSHGVYNQINIK